jgi:hypothetical protein
MTSSTAFARPANPSCTAEAQQLLRDAAFILRLTRRVKEEILRETAGPRPALQLAERPSAVLGV